VTELSIDERVAPTAAEMRRLVHTFCCNPDLSDCGKDLSGRPVLPDDTTPTCQICAIAEAEALPCADPDCPYREDWVAS
jgi:hypothetical protein